MSDCLFVKLKFDFHTLTPTVDLYRDQIFVKKFEEHVLNVTITSREIRECGYSGPWL